MQSNKRHRTTGIAEPDLQQVRLLSLMRLLAGYGKIYSRSVFYRAEPDELDFEDY
jgi:hypothetical protein